MTLEVSKSIFEAEVLKAQIPVVVDFWAEWCMPCKMMSPVLEELSSEYEGKIKIVKVDVDKEPDLSGQYQVVSIPTLLLFKDGAIVDQLVGAHPKDKVVEFFSPHL